MFRNGEKKRRFATKGALALLALATVAVLTGVSFASTTSVTSVTVTASDSGIATVDPAGVDGENGAYEEGPSWSVTPGTAGTTGNGTLYIIDTGDYTGDIMVTLYITNVADLAQRYTYMNLNTTVHEENGAGWEPVADSYLTLIGGYVTFILNQSADGGKYSLGINNGSFYANSKTSTGTLDPEFFVDIRQA